MSEEKRIQDDVPGWLLENLATPDVVVQVREMWRVIDEIRLARNLPSEQPTLLELVGVKLKPSGAEVVAYRYSVKLPGEEIAFFFLLNDDSKVTEIMRQGEDAYQESTHQMN
jgi:hypothetical protein